MPINFKKEILLYNSEDRKIIFYPFGIHKFLIPFFGFLFLNIAGLLIGILIGLILDTKILDRYIPPAPLDYGMTFMMLAMAVIRADGHIGFKELKYAYAYISTNFGEDYLHSRYPIFQEFSKQNIQVEHLCEQLLYHLDYSSKMQFLYFLFGLGYADNELSRNELELIFIISQSIGITDSDFISIKAMYSINEPISAYHILETNKGASNREIKKAYYRMAKKHHPDMIAHLGPEYQKSAKEKFQKIQKAYQEIKSNRGIV